MTPSAAEHATRIRAALERVTGWRGPTMNEVSAALASVDALEAAATEWREMYYAENQNWHSLYEQWRSADREIQQQAGTTASQSSSEAWETRCLIAERERDAAKDEYRRGTQKFVDAVCHYRNLAISLGAKPTSMLDKYDRKLCEEWDTYDHEDGWRDDDTLELWEELEAGEARVALYERALDEVDAPYPPDIFTPLSEDEMTSLLATMRSGDVRFASERWYSHVARERGRVARAVLVEGASGPSEHDENCWVACPHPTPPLASAVGDIGGLQSRPSEDEYFLCSLCTCDDAWREEQCPRGPLPPAEGETGEASVGGTCVCGHGHGQHDPRGRCDVWVTAIPHGAIRCKCLAFTPGPQADTGGDQRSPCEGGEA